MLISLYREGDDKLRHLLLREINCPARTTTLSASEVDRHQCGTIEVLQCSERAIGAQGGGARNPTNKDYAQFKQPCEWRLP
jgi:hypothetical protein